MRMTMLCCLLAAWTMSAGAAEVSFAVKPSAEKAGPSTGSGPGGVKVVFAASDSNCCPQVGQNTKAMFRPHAHLKAHTFSGPPSPNETRLSYPAPARGP